MGKAANTQSKSWLKQAMHILTKYVLPMGISIWLIVWFFHKVSLEQMMEIIRQGCDFRWITLAMVFVVTQMAFRGVRWGIQLRAVGMPRISYLQEWCSIFGAYSLNYVFPRLGEAWRCVYISRIGKTPLMKVIGTDVGDRTSDMFCVFFFILLAVIFVRPELFEFFDRYSLGKIIKEILYDKWLWIGLGIVVVGLWLLLRYGEKYQWVRSLRQGLLNAWEGFYVLFKLPQLGLYLWLTLGIWVSYFLQVYLCFFAFPWSQMLAGPGTVLGLSPGLMCLLFGSCSTLIPSNGGLGPWTIAIAYAVELYGMEQNHAAAFALTAWVAQAAITFACGIFAMIYISVQKRKANA